MPASAVSTAAYITARQNSLVAEVPNQYFGSRVTTRAELNEILQYSFNVISGSVSSWKIWSGETRVQKGWWNLDNTTFILSAGSEPVGKNEVEVASYLSFEHSNHKRLWFGEAQIPQLGVQSVIRQPLRTLISSQTTYHGWTHQRIFERVFLGDGECGQSIRERSHFRMILTSGQVDSRLHIHGEHIGSVVSAISIQILLRIQKQFRERGVFENLSNTHLCKIFLGLRGMDLEDFVIGDNILRIPQQTTHQAVLPEARGLVAAGSKTPSGIS
ncbi:hypothetical protein B0H14DRAFT_2775130 [Mycena olivaceomarginata]|nr:hypothetical protein B0H14DRAFT_2775130 [Mycena olivaceomarginata]